MLSVLVWNTEPGSGTIVHRGPVQSNNAVKLLTEVFEVCSDCRCTCSSPLTRRHHHSQSGWRVMWSLGECGLWVNVPLPCMYAFTLGHTQVTCSLECEWPWPCMYAFTLGDTQWSLGECSLCVNGPLPCMYAFTPGHTQVPWSVV